jgi:hypothetical protein
VSTAIAATLVRELDVSAASGLVAIDGRLHVVADDELDLFTYRQGDPSFRATTRLMAGSLPGDGVAPGARREAEHAARKRDKPDLEMLLCLEGPGGPGLLALGSGSTPARARGAWIRVDAGMPSGAPVAVDAAPLYEALAAQIPGLNLEGGAVVGDVVRLLQRGNGEAGESGVVDLDLAAVVRAIERGTALGPSLVRRVAKVELGALDGTKLGFTDASPLGGGCLVFTAAAEASADTYRDGPCAGSVVGVLDDALRVRWSARVEPALKLEGVHASLDARGVLDLMFVADADDPTARAPLLAARTPLPDDLASAISRG